MRSGYFLLMLLVHLIITGCDSNKEEPDNIEVNDTVTDTNIIIRDLNTPWEITWGPDNYIWMTERDGVVSRVNPDDGNKHEILKIEVEQSGESGLLGLALHPDFNNEPYVYLAYTYSASGSIKEKLSRFTYQQNKLINEEVLIENIEGNNYHDGARLLFGPDGKLYMSTGEAGNKPLSQNPASLNGKILRINPDGSVPLDNPINGSYVWATGLRNTQGLAFSSLGLLYGSEHGPEADDEINILEKGRNYGWPNVEGICDKNDEQEFCQVNNVAEPIQSYTPTLALAGISYYGSDKIPQWRNSLIVTSLKAGKLLVLHLSQDGKTITNSTTVYDGNLGRLRDVCVSPDGRVFFSTSNKDGRGSAQLGDDKIIEIRLKSNTN